ncbi:MAG: PhoH family protein [Clostridia bacterium]
MNLTKREEFSLEKIIEFDNVEQLMNLFGSEDENIRVIEELMDVHIVSRGTEIKIQGQPENIEKAALLMEKLMPVSIDGEPITRQNVTYLAGLIMDNQLDDKEHPVDFVCLTAKGKPIRSKTYGQKKYVETIRQNDITFGIGPAGTGKTFLAVAMAVTAYREKKVNRIILTRPAVEAGEKLGFLPGDLQSKVDPYLRPLYDAMYEILGTESFLRNKEKGIIEVIPLAYMRGRTLDDSFIILDEAQNTTREQMKMFLTRMGFGSKAIVNGDITQIDLPPDRKSGLVDSIKVLGGIKGIGFVHLTDRDVVRHELVQKIIKAYEKNDKSGRQVKRT